MQSDATIRDRRLPRDFGDYELLAEIARGGMGVVYRARNRKLNRIEAVKMILANHLASDSAITRFRTEAESAGVLDHPHIVPVYDVGEIDGQHYLSMGFIDGPSLQDRLRDGPLPANEAAHVTHTIAAAVQFAHEKGIVHRDLKPANVLLAAGGQDAAVDGVGSSGSGISGRTQPPLAIGIPRVTDFGLAKRIDSDVAMTRTGDVMGTPSYMPPEQAQGQIAKIGPRSDVYSIGAILYALLTGRPPFQAPSLADTLNLVINEEPVPPRQFAPTVPWDLETICLKCLEKDPEKRYQTAAELADDLRRYLDGQPISARPVNRMERTWRWCRRNPVVALLLTSIAMSLVAGVVVSSYFAVKANRFARDSADKAALAKAEADEKEKQRAAAEKARKRAALQALKRRLQLLRRSQLGTGWRKRAEKTIAEAVAVGPDAELRDLAVATFDEMDVELERTFPPYATSFSASVAFDSSGRRLLFGGFTDGRTVHSPARLWHVAEDRLQFAGETNRRGVAIGAAAGHVLDKHRISTGLVAFLPDGTPAELLIRPVRRVGDRNRPVLVLRSAIGQDVLKQFAFPGDQRAFPRDINRYRWAISGDGSTVAAAVRFADGSQRIAAWRVSGVSTNPMRTIDIAASDSDRKITENTIANATLALSQDGTLLAHVESRRDVSVWSTGDQSAAVRLPVDRVSVQSLAFHKNRVGERVPDQAAAKQPQTSPWHGWVLAIGDAAGTVSIWDLSRRSRISLCRGAFIAVYSMAFSPDGAILATGGRWGVRFWEVASGRQIFTMHSHPKVETVIDYVSALAFSPDGKRLAIATIPSQNYRNPHHLHVWKIDYGRGQRKLRGLTSQCHDAVFSRDGRRVAVFGNDWRVGIWDTETGLLLRLLEVPEGYYPDNQAMAFDKTGRRFAFSTATVAVLWNVNSGRLLRTWKLPPGMGDELGFNDRGQLISVRFELKDRSARPFTQPLSQRLKNPFVVRVRNLTGPDSTRELCESKPFGDIRYVFLSGDTKSVALLSLTPDDVAKRRVIEGRHVEVLSTRNAKVAWTYPSYGVSVSADGQYALCGGRAGDPPVTRWHAIADGKLVAEISGGVADCCGPGQHTLANVRAAVAQPATADGLLTGYGVFSFGAKAPLFVVGREFPKPFGRPRFSPDGTAFVVLDGSGTVHLCDIQATLKALREVKLIP